MDSLPVYIGLESVEEVKEKSKKTIDNIMSIFEDNGEGKKRIDAIKAKNPKISLEGMASEKIDRLYHLLEANEDVICETFDYENDRQKLSMFVNEQRLAGYHIFDSRVIDNKTAHVILYK